MNISPFKLPAVESFQARRRRESNKYWDSPGLYDAMFMVLGLILVVVAMTMGVLYLSFNMIPVTVLLGICAIVIVLLTSAVKVPKAGYARWCMVEFKYEVHPPGFVVSVVEQLEKRCPSVTFVVERLQKGSKRLERMLLVRDCAGDEYFYLYVW